MTTPLKLFRLFHGPGDGGSEHSYHCQNPARIEGWERLAKKFNTRPPVKEKKEVCEGCGKKPTCYDSDGVPLCRKCAKALTE